MALPGVFWNPDQVVMQKNSSAPTPLCLLAFFLCIPIDEKLLQGHQGYETRGPMTQMEAQLQLQRQEQWPQVSKAQINTWLYI